MVGTATARHLGRPELAIQTARRGYDAASALGDPALTAQLAAQRALGLTGIGARRRVTAVLDEALAAVTPVANPTAADTGAAEAAGVLHLTSAWHDAQQEGRDGDADAHMRELPTWPTPPGNATHFTCILVPHTWPHGGWKSTSSSVAVRPLPRGLATTCLACSTR
ncbi:MAG: hypothetical protein M3460_03570 [Actinomycetota bacterium]|nr:hypothetical protein [Actinomycetota bacterium]